MITVGIKFTHDGAVALFEDNRLIFSVEAEKTGLPRYAELPSIDFVEQTLNNFRYRMEQVDAFCVDGWKNGQIKRPAPMLVAPYHEFDTSAFENPLAAYTFVPNHFPCPYVSYNHLTGHIASAKLMAPFSREAYCLTWDGGQDARLHFISADNRIRFVGIVHIIHGIIYGIMRYYFGPYKEPDILNKKIGIPPFYYGGYEAPGKLMSYIGSGQIRIKIFNFLKEHYQEMYRQYLSMSIEKRMAYERRDGVKEHRMMLALYDLNREWHFSDEDVLKTVHDFLGHLLLTGLKRLMPAGANLLFAGGSALNIKWNSLLRSSGYFRNVFVPPVPNDSGSAIGAACCHLMRQGKFTNVDWDVYSGPELTLGGIENGWVAGGMNSYTLGHFLGKNPITPVVYLLGRAEIGPRALGHRSIFMSPTLAENKDVLNRLKKRESFRPVAPIVSEGMLGMYFEGDADPYMLYDHVAKESAKKDAPAIVHTDGTARVQTINRMQCEEVFEVVHGHYSATGIPIICNTSANELGKGFFPSLRSAMKWADEVGVRHIWCNGNLWKRTVIE